MENKTSLGSKILTVAFCLLLVGLTIFAFIYLLTGPDFLSPKEYQELYGTEPTQPSQGSIDYDALLAEATMQDMLDYLTDKGYINQENMIPMSVIGTDNWICDGLDLIWWDVANLVEGTEPYDYWTQHQENGFILYAGTIYAPTLYGPFGINVNSDFAGDPNRLDADMKVFGQWLYAKYGGGEMDLTAEYEKALWAGTYEELEAYLAEKGYIEPETRELLTTIGTENWLINGLDLMWWDVENLEEGTEPYQYWQEFEENGFIIFGGNIYAPYRYGPYAIYINVSFAGDADQLNADMKVFGQWLYEKNNAQ